MCRVESSTEVEDIGEFIALTDLNTDSPIAIFPSASRSPMKIISENKDMLVIQLVAGTGSTDTITIFKGDGRFQREAKGSVGGNYSSSWRGRCRS